MASGYFSAENSALPFSFHPTALVGVDSPLASMAGILCAALYIYIYMYMYISLAEDEDESDGVGDGVGVGDDVIGVVQRELAVEQPRSSIQGEP
mmetsp:Transcript_12769/g.21884  ORF Transcript_12769/g.21884 Transcript_12769/m.21884 type:complete len:94 (-) Transcript_12769:148-429(-)